MLGSNATSRWRRCCAGSSTPEYGYRSRDSRSHQRLLDAMTRPDEVWTPRRRHVTDTHPSICFLRAVSASARFHHSTSSEPSSSISGWSIS